MQNFFYEIYQYANSDPKWLAYTAPVSKTNIIDQEELDAALAQMGESKFKQEFECDWIANIEGSIFGNIIKDLDDKKQLTNVVYDPTLLVNSVWDIGVGDSTAIIFYQRLGNTINIIDYYENRREGLPHYVEVLKEKSYVYDKHFAPHDIEVQEFSSGKTRREVAWQLGINFKILPKIPLEDGIHSLKMVLPRCYFDTDKTKPLIDALRHYHRKFNEKMRMFNNKPVHDWSSHAADSARYMAMSINDYADNKKIEQKEAMMPAMPAVPAVQPLPAAPNYEDEDRKKAAAEEAASMRRKRVGRSATILTSPLGDESEAELTKKTLLGG